MDNFQKEFVLGFFLDDANLSTVNKSVMAMTNLLMDNVDNLDSINEAICMEKPSVVNDKGPPQILKDYYEQAVLNFSDEDYENIFKAKKTTVQVKTK